jgi:type IV pilus assembly protein PilY1
MRDPRPAPVSRTALLALAVASALLAPGGARAANKIFAAGSLIIPPQLEYQNTEPGETSPQGILAAYGLVYGILRRSQEATLPNPCVRPVTLYWAIAPNKLSQYRCDTNTNTLPAYSSYNDNDGCDLVVQSSDGVPVAELASSNNEAAPFYVWHTAYTAASGPARGGRYQVSPASPKKTAMKYLGAPWIVDATDRQCFLAMLATYPELAQYHAAGSGSANYVRIHSARATFTAPIGRLLNQSPPKIAVTGAMAPFIENVIANAGLSAITDWNAGVVFDRKTEAELLDSTPLHPRGLLNDGGYGLFWGADEMAALTNAQRSNFDHFLDLGNGAYVEANSIDVLENTGSPLVTTTGILDVNPNIPFMDDCNDRKPGVATFKSNRAGNCFTYAGLGQPWAQTGNLPFQGGQSSYKGFTPSGGFQAGVAIGLKTSNINLTAARFKDNDQERGLVIYLAGMRFDNARFWGMRMIMNSVLANVPLILGVELARSEPVGFRNGSVSPVTDRVYQGTYFQLPDPPETHYRNYSTTFPQRWRFPFTAGHLYEYDISDIPNGSKSFNCATGGSPCPTPNWDAALKVPLPQDRTIYTALGGSAHIGWKRVIFDYNQTRSGCLDADGNSLCDLSERLAQCNTAGVVSEDLLSYNDPDATQRDVLGMFVQQVRGHCSAHVDGKVTNPPIDPPIPSDAQCDDPIKQKNIAKLGGIDHGSPAIVGRSRYVTEDPWTARPVVAYAGARDGMLHAFYVSGGTGWKDPAGNALGSVARGQELWAFLPPGQLCNLHTNNAMVDASVNVIDVFADFPMDANNDGVIDWTSASERPDAIREWRTVLLAAAGEGGSELFALDVTSPVHPVLLWHVGGEQENDGRFDVNGDGAFETFDKSKPHTYATKWFDWDDADEDGPTSHIPTDYNTKSAGILDELKFGRYDYRNLGLTYGTAIGKVSTGDAFQYVAYIATSMVDFTKESPLGFRGVEVFALDLVTGKKLWQWERAYRRKNGEGTVIADNTIPGRVALADVNSDGSVDRIYVGDLEGHLWELSALDGRNLNYLPDKSDKFHSFPLFGTRDMVASTATPEILTLFKVNGGSTIAQQPLTSPIGLGRFTKVSTALEPYLKGRLAIVQGAMGVDWSIAPFEEGSVYIIPVAPEAGTRVDAPVNLSEPPNPLLYGVLKEPAAWRVPLRVGERVFGMPRIVNNEIIFNTAFGSFSGDITESITEAGSLYEVGTDSSGQTQQNVSANLSKSFGGVLVFGDQVIITTDNAITKKDIPPGLKSDGDASKRPFNRNTPAVYRTWEPGDAVKQQP